MDRSSAGINGQYARSHNDYNRPNDQAASSRRGRFRHATIRQWDDTPRTNPGHNKFYRSSDARPSQHLQCRSVTLLKILGAFAGWLMKSEGLQ